MNPLQVLCCTPRCIRVSRIRVLSPKLLHARRFASRASPGRHDFKTGKASSVYRSPKANAPGFNPTGPSTRPNEVPKNSSTTKAEKAEVPPKVLLGIRWRLPIGPRKLFFLSIAALIGYGFYKWLGNVERSLILNPQHFLPFILTSREMVSSTCAIVTVLSVPKGQTTANVSEAWRRGVWSVQVIQPELQAARPYTPLPPTEGMDPQQIRLYVRLEPQGEVSTFLHTIYRGTIVHLRGPRVEYQVPEDVDEILFLAGGTGIAPALQIAHTLFNHRNKSTGKGPELRILWANRRREDSFNGHEPLSSQPTQDERPQAASLTQPEKIEEEVTALPRPLQNRLAEEVESLRARHGGKVIVDYLVDEEGSYITESLLREYLSGSDQTVNQDGTPRRKVVVISGPEGFVDIFAGPKTWRKGREIQGPLGGLLKKINPQGWEIQKL